MPPPVRRDGGPSPDSKPRRAEPQNAPKLRRALTPYHGRVFRWQPWKAGTHPPAMCLNCAASFGPADGAPGMQTEGWITLAQGAPAGFEYEWLCRECFAALHDELGLIADPDHPMWKDRP